MRTSALLLMICAMLAGCALVRVPVRAGMAVGKVTVGTGAMAVRAVTPGD